MEKNSEFDIAIIGGGAAGMMAAIQASQNDKTVVIIEKNVSLGKKLLLTGNGRCNLTTDNSIKDIIKAFGENGKFLYGPVNKFSNEAVKRFFESADVPVKVERGARVFPASDKAEDVLRALLEKLKDNHVNVITNTKVESVTHENSKFEIKADDHKITTNKLIIATGGKAYPSTGSTGDGYKFAKSLGHTITDIEPALVPLIVENPQIRELAGLSLKNVELSFRRREGEKPFTKEFGELLFTHTGISGPIVLSQSKIVAQKLEDFKVVAQIDLKPALSIDELLQRIEREIHTTPKSEYHTLLKRLLPSTLVPLFVEFTSRDRKLVISEMTRLQKEDLANKLKKMRFIISKTAPVEAGIITSGGVDLKEVDSRTMESKIVSGLYFAGEILDLDGPTGGYNLQEAWSTGYVAGINALKSFDAS